MLDELQKVLGIKVDLVMSGAVRNAIIAREIEKTKRIIYNSRNNCLPLTSLMQVILLLSFLWTSQ